MNILMIITLVSLSLGTWFCGLLIVRGLENSSVRQESSTAQAEFPSPTEKPWYDLRHIRTKIKFSVTIICIT